MYINNVKLALTLHPELNVQRNFMATRMASFIQLWYSIASSCSHFCLVTQRSSSFVGEECWETRQNTAARETSSAQEEAEEEEENKYYYYYYY